MRLCISISRYVGPLIRQSIRPLVPQIILAQQKWWKMVKNNSLQLCNLTLSIFHCQYVILSLFYHFSFTILPSKSFFHNFSFKIFHSQTFFHKLFLTIFSSQTFFHNFFFSIFFFKFFFFNIFKTSDACGRV